MTTGHPTIDVFFSSAAMEPADGAAHYTERLVTLPGHRHAATRARGARGRDARARSGCRTDATLLLCPQSLFKIHPDNDALFARVLAAVPDALLVALRRPRSGADRAVSSHGSRALARTAWPRTRVRSCSPQRRARRISCASTRVCDVMLDTLHWSGGNTSLDALACGLPIVTLPGPLHARPAERRHARADGRRRAGRARRDDYVRIAARLATDREFHDQQRARIWEGAATIFGDARPVRALGDAIERLVRGA